MIELLLSLPDLVGGLMTAVIATAVGVLVYLVSYKLISRYQINDLEPQSPVQEVLKAQMMNDIERLYDFRRIRLNNTLSQPPVYTFVIILGFIITVICFGVYKPQGPLIVLLSLYTAFIGAVLY